MTFEELLDQAIALLQRRGRLTYRALKRQLNVDDDYLEDLKAELIQGQRLAVDEDGAVLVWSGAATSPPVAAVPPPLARRAQTDVPQRLAGQVQAGQSAVGGPHRHDATPCPDVQCLMP